MNSIERSSIAKDIADYMIDHLLVEEPMSAKELEGIARDIIEDRVTTYAEEFQKITQLAINTASKDRRVIVKYKGKTLWIYHKESLPSTEYMG